MPHTSQNNMDQIMILDEADPALGNISLEKGDKDHAIFMPHIPIHLVSYNSNVAVLRKKHSMLLYSPHSFESIS